MLGPTPPVQPAIYSYEGGGGEAGGGTQKRGPSLPEPAGVGCRIVAESFNRPAAPSTWREGAGSMEGGGPGPSRERARGREVLTPQDIAANWAESWDLFQKIDTSRIYICSHFKLGMSPIFSRAYLNT